MLCLHCNHAMTTPGLVVAMEQREHFALTRHAEVCPDCARKMGPIFLKEAENSRFLHQSMNCVYCGNRVPMARFRFDVDQEHHHLAMCEKCYQSMRDKLIRQFPNVVAFVEKEYVALHMNQKVRMPWSIGAIVQVKEHMPRFGDKRGTVVNFRGLVNPWYGYMIRFPDGTRHFFHERDLDLLHDDSFSETSSSKDESVGFSQIESSNSNSAADSSSQDEQEESSIPSAESEFSSLAPPVEAIVKRVPF